jgi:hypothetical protein
MLSFRFFFLSSLPSAHLFHYSVHNSQFCSPNSVQVLNFLSLCVLCVVLSSVLPTLCQFSIFFLYAQFSVFVSFLFAYLLICFHYSVHISQFCSLYSVPVLNILSLCKVFSSIIFPLRLLLICFLYIYSAPVSLTFYLSSLILIFMPCSQLLLLVISSLVPLLKSILLL